LAARDQPIHVYNHWKKIFLYKILNKDAQQKAYLPLLPVKRRSSTANSESTAFEWPTAVQHCMMGQLGVPLFAMELITPLQDITAVHVTGMHVQRRQTHIDKKRKDTY